MPTEDWIPKDTFGARLALVRQHMGWNVKEAGEACDITPNSWSNWEHGRKPRDLHDVARTIADASGCSYRWLMLGSGGGLLLSPQDETSDEDFSEAEPPDLMVLAGGRKTASKDRPLNVFLAAVSRP